MAMLNNQMVQGKWFNHRDVVNSIAMYSNVVNPIVM